MTNVELINSSSYVSGVTVVPGQEKAIGASNRSPHPEAALKGVGRGESDLCLGYGKVTVDSYILKFQLFKPVDTFALSVEKGIGTS